jgi:hypothetical protein
VSPSSEPQEARGAKISAAGPIDDLATDHLALGHPLLTPVFAHDDDALEFALRRSSERDWTFFGRPFGLPHWPGLNRFARGGRP